MARSLSVVSASARSRVDDWRLMPVHALLLALLYFCSARISLLFAYAGTNASPFWPPAGLALAALAILGWRAGPGILIGACAANLVTFLGNGQDGWQSILLSLLIGMGNTAAAVVAWLLCGRPRLQAAWRWHLRDALRFVGAAAIASGLSATIGCLTLHLGGLPADQTTTVMRVWALGDFAGLIVFTPLICAWWTPAPALPRPRVTWLPLLTLVGLVGWQVTVAPPSGWPLLLMPVPAVAAALLGHRRSAWNLAALGVAMVIWQTISGQGPFAHADEARSMAQLQFALATLALLPLVDATRLGGQWREADGDGPGQLLRNQPGQRHLAILPAVGVFALGALVTLIAWRSLETEQIRQRQQADELAAEVTKKHLEAHIQELIRGVERNGRRWDDVGGTPEQQWRRDAQRFYADSGSIQALEWVDSETVIRWIEPLAGNEAALGLRLSDESRRRAALERARSTGRPVLTTIVELKQGGAGFVMYKPLESTGAVGGYIVCVFRLQALLDHLRTQGRAWDATVYHLVIRQQGRIYHDTRPEPRAAHARADGRAVLAELLGEPMSIEVFRHAEERRSTSLPALVLNTGLLLASLLAAGTLLLGITLEQARLARAAVQAKARFLANMSHEIRTPMNGVLGAAQIGLAHSQDPVAREHLQLIHSSGQTLLAILNDILDFSKIESQQLHLERVPTDLAAVASDSCALLRPGAAAKGLRLELELGDHLPPRILGDPVRLRQILLNLLTNAVKFTSSGAVTLQLSNSHTTAGRQLHIHCRDTGMGMDAETVDRLFTPFTQADASTTRRFGGTGLGLAIVHHLVSLHGGRITCSSRPGVGTTFHLTLPLELADDDGAIAALPRLETLAPGVVPVTPLADSPIANTATTAQRVLLAEDNPVNQRVVRAMLTGLGCQVTVVDHGAAAVEHCLATLPDLVFMDMQMPIMDGLEACRRIRAAEGCSRHTPIVALTANAFDDDRIACREAGMDDFLAKPVDLASLRDLVQRITRPSAG